MIGKRSGIPIPRRPLGSLTTRLALAEEVGLIPDIDHKCGAKRPSEPAERAWEAGGRGELKSENLALGVQVLMVRNKVAIASKESRHI